jgi:hypothetical protein
LKRAQKLANLGLIFVGLNLSVMVYSQDQSGLAGETDDLLPDCISEEHVPRILRDTDSVQSARENGIICAPVVDQDNPPAPEGMAVYDATGGTERRQVEAAVVDELMGASMFESLLPAPRLQNTASEEEYRTGFGFRDLPIEPINDDPNLEEAPFEFDFDAQMAAGRGNTAATVAGNPLSDPFADRSQPTQSGAVEIGDIYAAREQIALDATKQELFSKSQQVASRCQCVFNSDQCYQSPPYQFDELNTVVSQSESNLKPQRAGVCNGWLANLRGKTSDNQGILDSYVDDTNIVLRNLETLDSSYYTLLADLDQKEVAINNEIRRQEQARQTAIAAQNSGPSGWQVLGAAIGAAGIASAGLPTDQAARLGSAFINDMLSDGSGSSLAGVMQDNGYGSVPSYDFETPSYDSYSGYDSPNPAPSYEAANTFPAPGIPQDTYSPQAASLISTGQSADLYTRAGCESEGWSWSGRFDSCDLTPSGSVSASASIQKCQALGGRWEASTYPRCALE